MSHALFSRRGFLRYSALGASAALLAACAPRVVKETVVVEKEVEKEVTKVVEVEKEVEKEVTRIVEVPPKTPEEILTEAGNMPGSPDHPKGWRTTLPDLPPGVPHTPALVITNARRVDVNTEFMGGDDLENNPWTRMVKTLFGIEYKVLFTWMRADEGQQKYNLAMASGDLPDFMEEVPNAIFAEMVEADLLEDITDAWDMYASPTWKGPADRNPELAYAITEIEGRKYGICRCLDISAQDSLMWFREDWLEKVGKDVPKTLDDCRDVALAFMEANLGQGAVTVGIPANNGWKARNGVWNCQLEPVWGAWRTMPEHWTEEGDALMYNAIRPICKEPLELLRQWYVDGILPKDFYALDSGASLKFIDGNQCGLLFNPAYNPFLSSVKNDPSARWNFSRVPLGPTGQRGVNGKNPWRYDPFCFRKGAEQAVEGHLHLCNWWGDLFTTPWRRMHGWEGHNYSLEDDKYVPSGVGFQQWSPGPIGAVGGGILDPYGTEETLNYRMGEWGKIPPEQRDAYQAYFFDDPTGLTMLNNQARLTVLKYNAEDALQDRWQYLPTPTMAQKWADLKKIEDETYLGIVVGEKPLSAFDEFVGQWKQLGGDQITEEVTEVWRSKRR